MFTPLFCALLSYIPLGLLVVVLKWRDRQDVSRGRHVPVAGKLLRAPGESVRKRAADLNCKLEEQLFWFLIFPPLLWLIYYAAKEATPPSAMRIWHIILGVMLVAYSLAVLGLVRIRRHREQNLLGYRGERAVGEELNRLMLDGCHVYHDYPLSKKWNLDHVVVAPSGVYAVETKTRSKWKATEDQPAHEVIYDGICLQFPGWYDSKSPARACDQAEKLAKELSEAMKEPVPVKPILTLPGWYVTCKGEGEVTVVNPKMIRSEIVTDDAPVLSNELIKDISRYLERQCRDVEF
jgi:Nuclease-related domain